MSNRPFAPRLQTTHHLLTIVALALVGILTTASAASGQAPTPPPWPTISSVSPAVVDPGDKVVIKGTGFIDIRSVSMAGFSLPYKLKSRKRIEARVPANATRGLITVSTRGGVANSPRIVIVKPGLEVSPSSGAVGTAIRVKGSGFIPGEPVDLFLGRFAQSAAAADRKGEISASFPVPARTEPGSTFVRAQGRFSGVPTDRAFTVTTDDAWPQRGLSAGGNRRSGDASIGAAFAASLILDWAADTIGPTRSSPAVRDGQVAVGADTGAVLLMPADCASGGESCAPRAIGVARGPVSASPAIAGSLVIVGSEDGSIYAFDLNCGPAETPCDPVWSYETGGPIKSSPAVDRDTVVVGSGDGNVYAFDLTCGLESEPGATAESGGCSPRWVGETGGPIASSPAVHDGVAFIGSDDGYLHAFGTSCGSDGDVCSPTWRGWTGGAVRSSPAVANGLVYVGSYDGKVHGFATGCGEDGDVCQAIWRGDASAPVESAPAVADGYVVVGANDGSVQAFSTACSDRDTGCKAIWTAQTGDAVHSSPAVTGSTAQGGPMVFVGSDDGFLYGYPLRCRPATNPGPCFAVWASGTSAPITASPAIVDGAVYVSSEDGTVRRWSLP